MINYSTNVVIALKILDCIDDRANIQDKLMCKSPTPYQKWVYIVQYLNTCCFVHTIYMWIKATKNNNFPMLPVLTAKNLTK